MSPRPRPLAPVLLPVRVAWGEMDALGHVNNVVYFRYFESSRVAYIDRLGWRPIQQSTGIGFILQSVQARFRRPLVYPDTIHVSSKLLSLESDRFTLGHEVYSEALQDIAAVGEGTIVIYDYRAGAKAPMPDDLASRIRVLEVSASRASGE